MTSESPILPAHIDETIQAIARLHAAHRRRATPLQRVVEELTAQTGRPRFIGFLTVVVVVWVGTNLALPMLHRLAPDPPPFYWLQTTASLTALYLAVLILTTQRRAAELTDLREQLTLDLSIISEQKSAKAIQLLEEMRRDNPLLVNRRDDEAKAMSSPADPEAVLHGLRTAQEVDAAETTPIL